MGTRGGSDILLMLPQDQNIGLGPIAHQYLFHISTTAPKTGREASWPRWCAPESFNSLNLILTVEGAKVHPHCSAITQSMSIGKTSARRL